MQTRKRLFLVALLGIWIAVLNRPANAAALDEGGVLCEESCGQGNACDHECWLTQFDFDQEYPPTTCGEQSYSCCGDGVCDSAFEGGCSDDCGTPNGTCGVCDLINQTGCSTGQVCNIEECCVTPGGNGPSTPVNPRNPICYDSTCDTDSDCCPGDHCYTNYTWQGGVCVPFIIS